MWPVWHCRGSCQNAQVPPRQISRPLSDHLLVLYAGPRSSTIRSTSSASSPLFLQSLLIMTYLSVFLCFSLLDLLDHRFDFQLYRSFCTFLFLILWITGSTTNSINLSVLFSSRSTGLPVRLRTVLRLRLQFLFHNPDQLTLQF